MITLTLVMGVLLLLAAFALYTQTTFFANSTGTYQTTVTDKMEQQTVIYAGVFIPMKIFSIKTSENMEIKVERNRYLRVSIGDYVTVTSYSNGLHRLQL
jgi:hypothetical protein